MTPNCSHHPDRLSTHVVGHHRLTPICDECAESERRDGAMVQRHAGYLWGYPIVLKEDPLDAEFIDA